MGIFDKIKSTFGGGKPENDTTVAPSQLLREAGIDPAGLKFAFGPGSISVSGSIAEESERARIIEILSGYEGISRVEDKLTVAPPAQPAPETAAEPAAEQAAEQAETEDTATEAAGRSYTVQSGDSLWKIAEEMYGNGSKYMAIFDANKDILENPDRIFPGQELKIPDLED
jgi:nucleoid-associated protein YgaU